MFTVWHQWIFADTCPVIACLVACPVIECDRLQRFRESIHVCLGAQKTGIPEAETIKKTKNSTQNKSQSQSARAV